MIVVSILHLKNVTKLPNSILVCNQIKK